MQGFGYGVSKALPLTRTWHTQSSITPGVVAHLKLALQHSASVVDIQMLGELFMYRGWPPPVRQPLSSPQSGYIWIAYELQVGTSLGRRHNLVRFQI